ncbi:MULTISPECIES: hypothetical protein [Vibrio]|uniref:hypothetical protein n=1 Tax=Vibrio TaxID=662 RepID=UPI000663266C|nr:MULTISPECIES: hypothetical protein [Vibrio]EIF2694160.1 hypothetical protein [Vibrio parahaemolyticus]CSA26318.1 Uncharacterised protein [Vibrio cholerae]MBY7696252.1 hypothetical protein [Vibrio alginolyticus]MCR9641714.1 hypothetical protein [Vibrio alginolyticus]MCS0083208.1 hypothetical protein [Vibrio alginolyticus]
MVRKLESEIRDYINASRRQFQIMGNKANWNKLCSALDLVGDTELAIEAYPNLCSTESEGASYLIVYGVLQTLLLQQDAAKHIADSLELKNIKRPKQLDEIRIIRNSAAGHPTSQKENGAYKSCFISRISLSPVSFQMVTSFSNSSESKFTTVSIPSLIEIQGKYIAELLKQVVDELKKQEMEHRLMYKDNKLEDSFPQTLSYHLGKIYEATYTRQSFALGKINLTTVSQVLEDFKNALESRSEWGVYDSVNFHYEQLEYPLQQLELYFNRESKLNEKDAYIFASFVERQFDELIEIAKDIDKEYESEC